MSVVGIIIPMGFCHQTEPNDLAPIYPLPFKLRRPYKILERIPTPEDLPAHFDDIVNDVRESYHPENVIRGINCFMTSEVHVSHIEMAFYTGLYPGFEPTDWWEALAAVESSELACFQFDGQNVWEARHYHVLTLGL